MTPTKAAQQGGSTIHIPADLATVSKLLTSRHWERAAIVWAYCEPQQGKRTSGENTQGRMSFDELAELGIAGLRTRKTWPGTGTSGTTPSLRARRSR